MTPDEREAIAKVLETVARDGLPGPRDLDVALDAIEDIIGGPNAYSDAAAIVDFMRAAGPDSYWGISRGQLTAAEPMWGVAIWDKADVNGNPLALAESDTLADALERCRLPQPAEVANG